MSRKSTNTKIAGALSGKKIVITRPKHQASSLVKLLESSGAVPILLPTIEINPNVASSELDAELNALGSYDWVVFTSVNGVKIFFDRLRQLGLEEVPLSRLKFACIGPSTKSALESYGIRVDVMPNSYVAEALLQALLDRDVSGQRILLARADSARPVLRKGLEAAGAIVREVPIYRTIPVKYDREYLKDLLAQSNAITFTSSSTVKYFLDSLGDPSYLPQSLCVACIGPITADTAKELGLRVDVVANVYTVEGLVKAIEKWFVEYS